MGTDAVAIWMEIAFLRNVISMYNPGMKKIERNCQVYLQVSSCFRFE